MQLRPRLKRTKHRVRICGADDLELLVESLRHFSGLGHADIKPINLHEGIESTLLILQSRLKERSDRPAIQIHKQYNDLPPVECYPSQLNQVVVNILGNAIDAIDKQYRETQGRSQAPTLWIETSLEPIAWQSAFATTAAASPRSRRTAVRAILYHQTDWQRYRIGTLH